MDLDYQPISTSGYITEEKTLFTASNVQVTKTLISNGISKLEYQGTCTSVCVADFKVYLAIDSEIYCLNVGA
jgi:hypothetical protein